MQEVDEETPEESLEAIPCDSIEEQGASPCGPILENAEKIRLVEEIVVPYFRFEMDDFYGDRGGAPYPKIEELTHLFFKQNGKDRTLVLTKNEEKAMLEKIADLGIGSVEIIQIRSLGRYIEVTLPENK